MTDTTRSKHIREIDVQKAAEITDNNVYSLIVLASAHARNIADRRNKLDAKHEKLHDYGFKPINQALDDFQQKYL